MENDMGGTLYELYMVRGPEPGKTFPLVGVTLSIGRDPQSDFLINDPEVSRQQALLVRTASGEYRIQDLGSTNGTFVDGQRLGTNPVILRPLQAITIGAAVTIILRKQAGAAEAPSAVDHADSEAKDRESSRSKVEDGPIEPDVARVRSSPALSPAWHDQQPRPRSYGDSNSDAIEKPAGSPLREQNVPSKIRQQAVTDRPVEAVSATYGYDAEATQEMSPNLILGLVLLILCGCMATLLFIFYLGGDWLLRQAGIVP